MSTSKLSTKSQRGAEAVINRIARCVQDAVNEADLAVKQVVGIGIGAPGAVDFANGTVIFAPNLEGWTDIPLKKALEKKLGVPVFVENDCNICALGVYVTELKSKPRSMIGIFVGTGIWGRAGGQRRPLQRFLPYRGRDWAHGPGGQRPQMRLRQQGLLRGVGQPNGHLSADQGRHQSRREDPTQRHAGRQPERPAQRRLAEGDPPRRQVRHRIIEGAAEYIGIATANLVNILNPEVVVLGGGVIEALADEMMGIIVETAQDYAMPGTMKGVEIIASRLGDSAGITGGAVLARREVK